VLSPDNPTTDGLLAALRRHTNRPTLSWAVPPAPLAGGFWAETFAVQLSGAPPELEGRLVARIMPDPATAAFETAVHRHLTRCRFPAPSIRCADGPSTDLDRAWSLMDFATGRPLLAGLRASTAIKHAPTLLRRLPDLLADAAATLHHCPLDGLDRELADHTRQPDIHDFLERIAAHADAIGRHDLARIADQLCATAQDTRVICHGDLHPFNLLVDGDRWTLIDWSAAVVADPHYDLAFTTLMLANPPLGGAAPIRAATCAIGTTRQPVPADVRTANRALCRRRPARLGSPRPRAARSRRDRDMGSQRSSRRASRTSLADDATRARSTHRFGATMTRSRRRNRLEVPHHRNLRTGPRLHRPHRARPVWSEALGYATLGGAGNKVMLVDLGSVRPTLVFQAVRETRPSRTECASTSRTPDLTDKATRVDSLGARQLEAEPSQ